MPADGNAASGAGGNVADTLPGYVPLYRRHLTLAPREPEQKRAAGGAEGDDVRAAGGAEEPSASSKGPGDAGTLFAGLLSPCIPCMSLYVQ